MSNQAFRTQLVSVDIGGTLARAGGDAIGSRLLAATAVSHAEARRALRTILNVAPDITEDVVSRVCRSLNIDRAAFPRQYRKPHLQFFPSAVLAVEDWLPSAGL